MRKSPIIILLLVLISQNINGQKNKGGLVLNAGAGVSMFGIFGSLSFSLKDEFTVESKSTTAFVGSLDYAFENKFSIGLGGGYQSVSQTISDYTYTDLNGIDQKGSFSYNLERLNVGARLLFHFGQGKVDAYIGIKPGVNILTLDTQVNEDIPNPSWLKVSGSAFALQFVPIGMRGYFTDNIGFFMELGVGAPTFISGGLSIGLQLPVKPASQVN